MTATNSSNTVKVRNLPHFASNPGKKIFNLRSDVTTHFKKSELITN